MLAPVGTAVLNDGDGTVLEVVFYHATRDLLDVRGDGLARDSAGSWYRVILGPEPESFEGLTSGCSRRIASVTLAAYAPRAPEAPAAEPPTVSPIRCPVVEHMRTHIATLGLAAICVGIGCGEGSKGLETPFGPVDTFPAEIDSIAAALPFPDKQPVAVYFLEQAPGSLWMFRVSYGEPQDCPSGCIWNTAWGIRTSRKIGWFAIDDHHSGVDPSVIDLLSLDRHDADWMTEETFDAVEAADFLFFRVGFLPRVAECVEVGAAPLETVAYTLFRHYDLGLARLLIRNPVVRSNIDLLFILAALPAGYEEVSAEARALLRLGR